MKELKDSMDTIRLTAADFLEKLEAAVAERSVERMTAMQYAEKLIADKEQGITIFDDEQRNLIVNFAFKLDDRAATEELVNGLAVALAEDDKEEVNRLMYDAQEKIENLPDGMIGLSEMHDYGYLKDDVLPLTKEGAREWHRLGERIYPLFRDGTAGDYASQEEIEQHDGIFGIKADAWDAILLEQREDYAEDEYARQDFQLTVINREQALRLYDEGKQIYLVRISRWPILVTAREEIERGSDTFQIAIADLEQERNMAERENMLLYGSEKQFGIYQITARDPEHDYRFMGLDYVQKKGITVARADYDLIYAAPLTEKDTLDGIYERFNIQRPADFTGHSLSVSDVVVLNDGSTVKAYYVDSIGFAELPDFFKERNLDLQKENLLNEELQEIEIFDKSGLFSNGRLRDEDVPEGLYRYDLRGSDYDPGQPITVEKTVVVNHAASVLMAEELDLGAEGRLELGEEGLNFTGAELTVREFMEEQQQKNNALIHGDSDHIAVEGHLGTWYAIDETEIGGEKFFLLEHEEHGDMAACVAVNEQGKLIAEDLWNGFDEDFQEAVQKYLSEKWNMPKKENVVSEIIEKAMPAPDNSAQDYSDAPVYYEPFSYAKENDEVDETVTIKASDGINLVGHYYERDKNAPLIIFFHGLWSNGYVSGEPTYKITKNQGWNLLLVSMRAHDESEGEFSTLGVIEQYDCKAWANWAVERFGEGKSVFFMGVSTGASVAMMSSNLGLPKSVRGIIDDCGFTSTMEMIDVNCKSHLPDYIPTRMFDFFVEMGTSVWGHFCISKADACKAVSQTDIPILIIHGDRDTKAPLSMAYRLYDSCSSEKQLYVVHGANHAESYRKDPEGYENVIAQFVEEHSEALKKEY